MQKTACRDINSITVYRCDFLLYTLDVPMSVSAVVGMGCTLDSQCTDGMANTVCSSSQCACASGYTGPACTGKPY